MFNNVLFELHEERAAAETQYFAAGSSGGDFIELAR
jgi:hypothetical protein